MSGSDTSVTCRVVCHPCSEWAAQLFALLLEVLRSLCISRSPQRIESNIFFDCALVSANSSPHQALHVSDVCIESDWQRPFDPHIKTPTVSSIVRTCNCNYTDMYMVDMSNTESNLKYICTAYNWTC